MGLKRKRSESELSGSSFSSSPSRPDNSCQPTGHFFWHHQQPASLFTTFARAVAPSHLPSRTFKRVRDNRPSEAEVHQRTLGLLFSAQHHHFPPQTGAVEMTRIEPSPVSTPEPSRQQQQQGGDGDGGAGQRSLHSFWKISSAPPVSSVLSTPAVDGCDDCGGPLNGSDDEAMDLDGCGATAAGFSCGPCGKKVCDQCSITNLGQQRRCLRCAGRANGTTGPVGWARASRASIL